MNYQLVKNNDWKEVKINEEDEKIPHHWAIEKISNLVKTGVTKGTTPSTIGFDFLKSGDIKFFKIEHMKNDILLDSDIFISDECNKKMKRSQLMENDILFSIAGTIGNIAIVEKKHLPANTNQAVAIIRFKNHEDVNFMKFYFKIYINKLTKNALKGVISNFNLGMLENLNIRFPSTKEKTIISRILSKQESIISNIEKLIEKNEIIFNELSEKLLSGELRLNEVDGKVSIYKNAADNWKEVEVNGKMKKIPRDWEVEVLKKHVKVINGYAFPKQKMENEKKENSIPIIKIGNIQENTITNDSGTGQTYLNGDIKDIFIPQYNDLIVGLSGANAGKTGVYTLTEKAALNQRNAIIRVCSNKLQQSFLNLFWFKEPLEILKEGIKDSAIPNISSDDIEKVDVFILSIKEQKEITDLLTRKIELINKQKQLLLKEKEKFEWLLDNLLSGNYLVKEIEN